MNWVPVLLASPLRDEKVEIGSSCLSVSLTIWWQLSYIDLTLLEMILIKIMFVKHSWTCIRTRDSWDIRSLERAWVQEGELKWGQQLPVGSQVRVGGLVDVQSLNHVHVQLFRDHGLQHARLLCPSLAPGACSNSSPLTRWGHPTISSSVTPFPSCLQSFPASSSDYKGSCRHQGQAGWWLGHSHIKPRPPKGNP